MRSAFKTFPAALILGTFLAFGTGCETAPKTETAKENLHDEVVATLNRFKREDPGMQDLLDRSAGYAVFPSVGKGGFIVGAAYGRGEVFRHGQSIGWADITQGSIGATVGGQEFAELIVFQTDEALDRFQNNNFTLGANATAVALKTGAAAATEFKDGVAVFVMTKGGLMADASISGQKFTFRPRQ
jgi:lipid-binding SYLF domain-containing protein